MILVRAQAAIRYVCAENAGRACEKTALRRVIFAPESSYNWVRRRDRCFGDGSCVATASYGDWKV